MQIIVSIFDLWKGFRILLLVFEILTKLSFRELLNNIFHILEMFRLFLYPCLLPILIFIICPLSSTLQWTKTYLLEDKNMLNNALPFSLQSCIINQSLLLYRQKFTY